MSAIWKRLCWCLCFSSFYWKELAGIPTFVYYAVCKHFPFHGLHCFCDTQALVGLWTDITGCSVLSHSCFIFYQNFTWYVHLVKPPVQHVCISHILVQPFCRFTRWIYLRSETHISFSSATSAVTARQAWVSVDMTVTWLTIRWHCQQ